MDYAPYTLLRDQTAVDHMDRLRRTYGFHTDAEVYVYAVNKLTWDTEAMLGGQEVGAHKDGVFQVVTMPHKPIAREWHRKPPRRPDLRLIIGSKTDE